MIWPDHFEDFIAASLSIIETVITLAVYLSSNNFQLMNLSIHSNETFTPILQFLHNHQQFFKHYLNLNSEVERITNNVFPNSIFNPRSIPEILDPVNTISPELREAYLISTNQMILDTQQRKHWKVISYQLFKRTNQEWLSLTYSQLQLQDLTKEIFILNHAPKMKNLFHSQKRKN
jgi:hypothetical protein